MTPLLYPSPLKKNATFGLVSPSRWLEPEALVGAQKLLEKYGYKVVIHPQNFLKDGFLAGPDASRVDAIMDMFQDQSIDAVLCARGGSSAIQIVDKLDYLQIQRNPKPFIGFSDITVLLQAITKVTGLVTYHGPMASTFSDSYDPRTIDDFFAVLQNTEQTLTRFFPNVDCVTAGRAEGILMGGNLSRLELLMATPYDWSSTDTILFIEDVDEVLYKIDEMLHHLRLANRFQGVRAILVGDMVDIRDGETGFRDPEDKVFGRDLRRIFRESLPADIPLCFNFPCGHGPYLTTFPRGGRVALDLNTHGASLSYCRP